MSPALALRGARNSRATELVYSSQRESSCGLREELMIDADQIDGITTIRRDDVAPTDNTLRGDSFIHEGDLIN